jgi:general secretion pathway protein D
VAAAVVMVYALGTGVLPGASAQTPTGTPAAVVDLPKVPGAAEFEGCLRIPPGRRFKFDAPVEATIEQLTRIVSTYTCRQFLLPSNARTQKVTIITPETVTAAEAYRIYLSALNSMGLTVEPAGRLLKVIESNRARESAISTYNPEDRTPGDDRWVTKILRPANVTADDLANVLARLKSKDGDITVYAPSNAVIITDAGSNLQRMEKIVEQLDVARGGQRIYILRVEHASASDVAQKLTEILQAGSGDKARAAGVPPPAPGTTALAPGAIGYEGTRAVTASDVSSAKVIADERTNMLIVVANEGAYDRLRALVRKLDVALEGGGGTIHVLYLENADAEALAGTLSSLGAGGAGVPRPGRSGGSPATSGGGAGGRPAGQSVTLFEGDVRITADKPTNSLVVVSSTKDFLALRDVVKKLDLPRRQVFIEATILEVTTNNARSLGASYHAGSSFKVDGKDSLAVFGVQHQDLRSLLLQQKDFASFASLSGLLGGVFGPPVTEATQIFGQAGVTLPSFGVVLQALQFNNDVNVLSTPHIITTDNEEAEISVGQVLPIRAGNPVGGGGATGLAAIAPIQRIDVALKLKITPHVNDSDIVRLQIENEISNIASEDFNGNGPSTNKRTTKTVVVVKDQQPVVLSGIIQDTVRSKVSKVPLLGDIPILGYLFKYTVKSKEKVNLLIFLTPYVIREPSDLRAIYERKVRERREFIERFTSFRSSDPEVAVDYRTKRGLLEEIHRQAALAEEEAAMVRAAEKESRNLIEEGTVELPAGVTVAPKAGSSPPGSPSPGAKPAAAAPFDGGPTAAPPGQVVPPPPATGR